MLTVPGCGRLLEFPPTLLATHSSACHRQSSVHLLNDDIFQNSLLVHFLFSFYICLGDLIYFHGFRCYLLLISSKSTFLFLTRITKFRDMTLGCVACSLNRILTMLPFHPPLWMASSITQFAQHCQCCLPKYSSFLPLVSSIIYRHLHFHLDHLLALNWSPASSPAPFKYSS